ncbi:phage capsid protein [Chelativorans xinjiangense]|uniref:phage capsid protein n=1 Tax=Chelativorans xinjiangense TaxID=2681485 RepID=UPI00135C127A|nr:phage capsid protein [Chelativorans xinjiangense]
MAVEAAVVQYRREFVASFEQRVSLLKASTTKESVINGNQATFLVSGSGGDTAVTRGTNGQIPYGNPTNTQVTATLVEKHAPYELTSFNIFASQGDQKRVMQMASMNVINRDIDLTILAELANATQDYGSGTASLNTVAGAKVILGNNDVDTTEADNMFAVVSPAFMGYLMQTREFASAEYVDVKPFSGPARKMLRWFGINWIESARVTGVGTTAEICYMFHRSALGYAVRVSEESISIGYDDKQDSSWSRATTYHAAKILQDTGIVKITHDGSAYVAT